MVPIFALLMLNFQKIAHKNKILRKINSEKGIEKVVKFSFSLDEVKSLKWEHSREFEYHGEMYDVIRYESHSGLITYTCWHDVKESTLNKKISRFSGGSYGSKLESNLLTKLYFPVYSPVEKYSIEEVCTLSKINYPVRDEDCISLEYRPESPPPELI